MRADGKEVFVCKTAAQLHQQLPHWLPRWSVGEVWAILLLQRAAVSLEQSNRAATAEKQRLRREFITFGFAIAFALQARGFATEVFDPRSASPLLSPPGEFCHNDVRAAAYLPDMGIRPGVCPMLVHPVWGTAVYPATILTAAPPSTCQPILAAVARARAWENLRLERSAAAPPPS